MGPKNIIRIKGKFELSEFVFIKMLVIQLNIVVSFQWCQKGISKRL